MVDEVGNPRCSGSFNGSPTKSFFIMMDVGTDKVNGRNPAHRLFKSPRDRHIPNNNFCRTFG
jgi:hypothetical protein